MRGFRGLLTFLMVSGLGLPAAQAEERGAGLPGVTLAAAGAGTDLNAAAKVTAAYALHAAAIYDRPRAAKSLIARGLPVPCAMKAA